MRVTIEGLKKVFFAEYLRVNERFCVPYGEWIEVFYLSHEDGEEIMRSVLLRRDEVFPRKVMEKKVISFLTLRTLLQSDVCERCEARVCGVDVCRVWASLDKVTL